MKDLTLSGGDVIPMEPAGLTVLVGANNVGKSRALQDVVHVLSAGRASSVVVNDVGVVRDGGNNLEEAIRDWLRNAYPERSGHAERTYAIPTIGEVPESYAVAELSSDGYLGRWVSEFCKLLHLDERFQLLESVGSYDDQFADAHQPLQVLFADGEAERELSSEIIRVFGGALCVHRYAGSHIHLLYGEPPEYDGPLPLPPAIREAYRAMPLARDQGHGIRSYAGIALTLTVGRSPIVLLDEPEACLHPPQARAMGRYLRKMSAEKQVIVATHSIEILLGMLDGGDSDLAIWRLTRSGKCNYASGLSPSDVQEVWGDSLLRASNVLTGLFHAGVVVCEGDADCRFYQAVLEAHVSQEHDLLFTHCGGKGRIKTAVRALRAVKTPVAAIVDLDVLRETDSLRALIDAFDGDWERVSGPRRAISNEIKAEEKAPSRATVRQTVIDVLDGGDGDLTRAEERAVRDSVRRDDRWNVLKRTGLAGLLAGETYIAAEKLLDYLASIGVFVVPVGELERWHPEIALHGPDWTASVLEKHLHENDSSAVKFVRRIESWLRQSSAGLGDV